MKIIKTLSALMCAVAIVALPATAADSKTAKAKQTCCEEAKEKGKDCTHKCCVAAHKDSKSCEHCNPNKEDVKKADKKAEKKSEKTASK
jgi:hypothetical protein